jgi:hypothetical protein
MGEEGHSPNVQGHGSHGQRPRVVLIALPWPPGSLGLVVKKGGGRREEGAGRREKEKGRRGKGEGHGSLMWSSPGACIPGVQPQVLGAFPRESYGTQGWLPQCGGPTASKAWVVFASEISGRGAQDHRTERDGLVEKKSIQNSISRSHPVPLGWRHHKC